MAGAELLTLQHEFRAESLAGLAHAVSLMPQDDHDPAGIDRPHGVQYLPDQRSSRERVKGLGKAGTHARSETGGEDHDRGFHVMPSRPAE
jgi:hypothetical protein